MRIPSELTADPAPRRRHRARWWLIGGAVVLIVLLVSLRSLANLYTDSLWFSSVGYHNVFSTLLSIKLGLFGVFGAIFFAVLWVNLVVCDRIAGHNIVLNQEDELVRRYQRYVRPYSGRIYVALAFVLALIGASGTIGQWNNWILFRHGGNFGVTDPQFGKDIGFYVFDLPFMNFVVDWTLAILIVTLAVTVVFHYLNGGIQPQRGIPRVRPPVKAHLSVLLALIALDKAAGYVMQRWSLVNAQDGYVNGAGYTDVHARLPAETLLIYVSIFAAVILLYNIRRQGWTLPVLAVGIWAFVALVVGVIYPALLQALKVTPAQSSLEAPYIKRNIDATLRAYGLTHVHINNFAADTTITPGQAVLAAPTIANVRQWDPNSSISLQTFQRLQAISSYYEFPNVAVDRYTLAGAKTPVLVGVRQITSSPSNLPSSSWVNVHLQYTHGNGIAVALANQTHQANPNFAVRQVPPKSSEGMPAVKKPDVYFGLDQPGYVVANTKQPEVDYQRGDTSVVSHYKGTGGVQLSSLFRRAAFAIRFGDLKLLISSQITNQSRIMFVRDPLAMAQKAAPFLSFDRDPYAVINGKTGHIDWIVDGYTTTANYAYSQNANTQQVAIGSGLPGSYNYVRNSVKVVIDAYSGKMTFYDADPHDPILRAYASAFPNMFQPLSTMPASLRAHLRYPPDIFSIQSAIYGRYHLKNPQQFYTASSAWQLSPTAGAGPQSQALLAQNTYNSQGQLVSSTPARMSPQYQVYSLPGTDPKDQVFTLSNGYVPASQSQSASTASGSSPNFNLTAWMVARSDPANYGQLQLYKVPQGTLGPANADAEISSNNTVSKDISLLDQRGSEVLLGETLMVPIAHSMVYLRPLYVAATTNSQPQLQYVIAVLGRTVKIAHSVSGVLSELFQTTVTLPSGSGVPSTGTVPAALAGILQAAQTDYNNALAALKAGNLAEFQADLQAMEQQLTAAQQVLGATAPSPSTSTTTTTTTTPPKAKKSAARSTSSTSTTSTSSVPSSPSTNARSPTSTGPRGATTSTSSSTTSTTLATAAGRN